MESLTGLQTKLVESEFVGRLEYAMDGRPWIDMGGGLEIDLHGLEIDLDGLEIDLDGLEIDLDGLDAE